MIKRIPNLGVMLPYIATRTVHAGEVDSIIWHSDSECEIRLVPYEKGKARILRASCPHLRSRYPEACERVMVVTYPDGYVSFCPVDVFLYDHEVMQESHPGGV